MPPESLTPGASLRRQIEDLITGADTNGSGRIEKVERVGLDADGDFTVDVPLDTSGSTPDQIADAQKFLFSRSLMTFGSYAGRLQMPSPYDGYSENVVVGDPERARTIYVRQFHDRPEVTDAVRLTIGDYQLEILRFLEASRPNHVFVEGRDTDLTPGMAGLFGNSFPELVAAFPDRRLPDELTDEHRLLLCRSGAAEVYAYFHPEITLHKTIVNTQTAIAVGQMIERDAVHRHVRNFFTLEYRESLAAAEVRRFREAHPDEDVVLIFGAAHDFSAEFAQGDHPENVTSIFFRRAADRAERALVTQPTPELGMLDSLCTWSAYLVFSMPGLGSSLVDWGRRV